MLKMSEFLSDDIWRGNFGDAYNERNANIKAIDNNTALFSRMPIENIGSAIEFGCGYGFSMLGLQKLFPELEINGVEINAKAAEQAKQNGVNVFNTSMINFILDKAYDFVLAKGLLMYLTDEETEKAYKILYEASAKYICICEYYNPSTVTINHRGNLLYKRDYGKILDTYPLELVDYGFVYHRDKFPQDDCTWFLFKK